MAIDTQAPLIPLQQWRQFLAVAQHLHMGRAAQALGMTQPPLTVALRRLETQLGAPLFLRTPRGMSLTAVGQALVPAAQQLMGQARGLSELAHSVQAGDAGHVRLGFVSTVGFGPLPGWLRGFREAAPAVSIALQEATSDVQWTAFARDELDAGLVLHVPATLPADVQVRPVLREPMVLALPQEHPLASRGRLDVGAVLAEPLVLFPRTIAPALHDSIGLLYRRHGQAPRIAQEAIQMQTIVNLVSAGMGLAWVPHSVSQLRRSGVVYRDVPRGWGVVPHSDTALVWRTQAGPATQRWVAHVLGHAAKRSAGRPVGRSGGW